MNEQRLLFILNQAIGDVVLTTGIISAAIKQYDNPVVTIVCSPITAPLFSNIPGLKEIIPVRRKKFSAHLFEIWPGLLRTRWTRIIDFRRTGLSRVLRGPVSYPVSLPSKPHKVVEMSSVLGRDHPPVSPQLCLVPKTAEKLADRILVLGPGASQLHKRWPADRFGELAARLTGAGGLLEGAKVVVSGGPMDKMAAETIASYLDPDQTLDLTGADLVATVAVMASASLFVGNDSGMMHLSAVSGAPTLGLFGPTNDALYHPWGDNAGIVKPPTARQPLEIPKLADDDRHMLPLTVDMVADAAKKMLAGTFSR